MHTIGLRELRHNLNTYIKLVQGGATITVMRNKFCAFMMIPSRDENREWKIITDFTKIQAGGILLDDILKEYAEKPIEPHSL